MMTDSSLRIAAGSLNQTPLDWDGNADRIRRAVRSAREVGVQLLCLPELCISGYGCEDAFHSRAVVQMSYRVLRELLTDTAGMAVALGLPLAFEGALYNCVAFVVDERLIGLVGKQNLANTGLHYEPRWFRPWPNNRAVMFREGDSEVPLGDLLFDCGGIRIGFEICEDAWVLHRPGEELAQMGVDILLNPSASHFAFGKHAVREQIVREGSRAFRAIYVYANLLGNEAGRAIYDGDCFIARDGVCLIQGPRFGFRDAYLTVADVQLVPRGGADMPPRSVDSGSARITSEVVACAFDWQARSPENTLRVGEGTNAEFTVAGDVPVFMAAQATSSFQMVKERTQPPTLHKFEEFTRAEMLGLIDYLRKSRAHGCVVSLSGGADSSAVVILVALAIRGAMAELGLRGFRERFAHVHSIQELVHVRDILRELLLCVYQATENSSATTRTAARSIATAVGARFFEWSVQGLVDEYTAIVGTALGRSLRWPEDDLALQNIQARARGPGVWLLANLHNALLLSTSNRSEAAVGYATMDGDTCGGLAPIAGIDKAFLRDWLRWMEREGPQGLEPIPQLAAVNALAPTAELRPAAAEQTDEGDLMPYTILEAIERAAIRDKLSPSECLRVVAQEFPEYTRQQFLEWIDRFFTLWCRNQWKRERYAPSFHLDDKNLDPKTWCRFPILSGGFARELREMRERNE